MRGKHCIVYICVMCWRAGLNPRPITHIARGYIFCGFCLYITNGLTVGRKCTVVEVLKQFNHFCAQPEDVWACDLVPRRLGAGGALTVLRFGPVRGCVRVLVFPLKWACVPGLENKGAKCRTRDNIVEGENFKEAIFFIFRPFQVPSEPR